MDSVVKQEPAQDMSSSCAVPIPGGHRGTRGVYDQFSPSPLTVASPWATRLEQVESPFNLDPDQLDISFKMDDDDIFQVDKADLIQGPTLAELNANDDTFLGDLNFDDLLLPEDRHLPLRTEPVTSGGSMFGPAVTGFASSSFPQSTGAYRSCQPYTVISGFNLMNGGISLMDNLEAVSPPAYPSPSTSHIAGMSVGSIYLRLIDFFHSNCF